jgi:hypothetical protein
MIVCVGFGAIFSYMAAMMTNVVNFSLVHRGKVVGILDASFSGGPALMALIYGEFFVKVYNDIILVVFFFKL